jgi:hypothetical protein
MPNSKPPHKARPTETEEQRQRRLAYHREWMRKWRQANPEKAKAVSVRYSSKNRDKIRACQKRRYEEKRSEIIAQVCEYARNNREKINARKKVREAKDPERARQLRRANYLRGREKDKARRAAKRKELAAYMRQKRNNDPKFLVADRLRRRINSALANRGHRKADSLVNLSACTLDELVLHIQKQFLPGMSWENRRQWHIDHIIPCSAFDLTDPAQQRVAFHYSNLRPVWSLENQRKHAKILGGQRQFFWSHHDIEKARRRLA